MGRSFPKEIAKVLPDLAAQGDERCSQIIRSSEALRTKMEHLAAKLTALILAQPPVQLLGYLWFQPLIHFAEGRQEELARPELEKLQGPWQTALEYFHAAMSCFGTQPTSDHLDPLVVKEILRLADELRQTAGFYCIVGSLDDDLADEFAREVSFHSKSSWVFIRSARYQVLEREFLLLALEPHDEALREAYGVGAVVIAEGIQGIADSLREGLGSAAERVCLQKERFYKALGEFPGIDVFDELEGEYPGFVEEAQDSLGDLFFGGVCNVSKKTQLPLTLLQDLGWQRGQENQFYEPGDYSGTPFRQLPCRVRPLVEIDGDYYATDPNSVRDYAYRAIQRGLLSRLPAYRELWNKRQNAWTEQAFQFIFCSQLARAQSWTCVFYQDIETGQWCESDAIVVLDDVLLVIEVKAGVAAMASPVTALDQHVRSVKKLVLDSYRQADRLLRQFEASGTIKLYQKNTEGVREEVCTLSRNSFRTIVPLGLTLESYAPYSAIVKEFDEYPPMLDMYPFVSMSIDDLLVVQKFLPSAGELMHYLEVRQAAAGIRKARMFDEMDHLGAYLDLNRFDKMIQDQMAGSSRVDLLALDGFSSSIDDYFARDRWKVEDAPRQQFPSELQGLLASLEKTGGPGWLKANALIRDCAQQAREELAGTLRTLMGTLAERSPRWYYASGQSSVLVWLSRYEQGSTLAAMIRQGEIIALANSGATTDGIYIEIGDDGSFESARLISIQGPARAWSDFAGLTHEAGAFRERFGYQPSASASAARAPAGKIGRNDPCWCGSGKKFKKCHGGVS